SIAKVEKPVSHFTLFNQQHMEFAIRHNLYYSRGPGAGHGGSAPVNWTIYQNADMQLVLFDWASHPSWEERPDPAQGSSLAYAPISDEHYLVLGFRRSAKRYTPAIDAACRKLILSILDTVKIQLSPNAQAQKE